MSSWRGAGTVRRARCVASRFSRSRSRRRARARRAIAPASRANTTTTTATTSPVVARRRPPPSSPRLRYPLPRGARRARDGGCARATRRARGEAANALLSDVGATPADELLWMSDQDAGPFGVVYAPLPDDADRNPPTPPTENLLPLLLTSSSSPYDFRARGPHDVSRRAVTFYWPALPANPNRAFSGRRSSTAPSRRRAPPPLPRRRLRRGLEQLDGALRSNLTHLASHGFVVVSPTGRRSAPRPAASFGVLADHLRACLDWAARETRRSNAPLFGQIDPSRRGLFGHSSGAGAAARRDGPRRSRRARAPAPAPPRSPAGAPSRPAPASTSTR